MQARLVLPAVVAAAVLTAGGAFWASAAGERQHGSLPITTLGQSLGQLAGISTAPTRTPTPTPTATHAPIRPLKPRRSPTTTRATTYPAAPPTHYVSTTPRPAPKPTAHPAPPAPAYTVTSVDTAVFNLLNKERIGDNVPPLRWSSQLFCSAAQHSSWMDARNTLDHNFPGEPSFDVRISACGFHGSTTAENIGLSYDLSESGALALEDYMYSEPHLPADNEIGHRRNILSRSFTSVGISVIIDQRTGSLWLTENFGG